MKKLILASGSPRRRELLEQAGIDFEVIVSHTEEKITDDMPEKIVMSLAKQKALDVAKANLKEINDGRIVLGADTVVVFDGKILGKPEDESAAYQMLKMLSNQKHYVYTGVCFVEKEKGCLNIKTMYAKTQVEMYEINDDQIKWYISTKEPMDKAGAYGIQGLGGVFVKSISGDYNTVVGLPLSMVWQYLYANEME